MINLNSKSIDPRDLQNLEFLSNLQGNILKGHGRSHTNHIFINFKPAKLADVKTWLKDLAENDVTSTLTQLKETEIFKRNGIPGGLFVGFYLSASGIQFLTGGVPASMEPAFKNGMKLAQLNDPAPSTWDKGYKGEIDAMLLIADIDPDTVSIKAKSILEDLAAIDVKVLTVEYGNALRNANGDGLEHFGYVDGVSQPLFIKDDVDAYNGNLVPSGPLKLDLELPLSQVLIADPLTNDPGGNSFGSYFVFRKLEQKVREFKTAEQTLATALGLTGEDRERAGAMIIGRFEDGSPITLNDEGGIYASGMTNNFDYSADTEGAKCPFHAHIRKSNPRRAGDTTHMMARRGIPFGARLVNTDIDPLIEQMPNDGVGLLFMSFQSSLANQFEFIQKNWVNNVNFPTPNTGDDPLIGQTNPQAPSVGSFPKVWNDPASLIAKPFDHFVAMKGGEYFYAPSLTFLKS